MAFVTALPHRRLLVLSLFIFFQNPRDLALQRSDAGRIGEGCLE
jgi:hypothetical protein